MGISVLYQLHPRDKDWVGFPATHFPEFSGIVLGIFRPSWGWVVGLEKSFGFLGNFWLSSKNSVLMRLLVFLVHRVSVFVALSKI
jgi:hypothetical protein